MVNGPNDCMNAVRPSTSLGMRQSRALHLHMQERKLLILSLSKDAQKFLQSRRQHARTPRYNDDLGSTAATIDRRLTVTYHRVVLAAISSSGRIV
jgi:hypothetical protein